MESTVSWSLFATKESYRSFRPLLRIIFVVSGSVQLNFECIDFYYGVVFCLFEGVLLTLTCVEKCFDFFGRWIFFVLKCFLLFNRLVLESYFVMSSI